MTKTILDEFDDFMDGKIFGDVAPKVDAPTPAPKEKNEDRKESRQVGNTFITISGPGTSERPAKKGSTTGKQKQNDAGSSDDSDDSDE